MEKLYYDYETFVKDTKKLVEISKDFNPDVLLAIARGGLTLGHFMASAMDIRDLYTLNSIHYDKEKKLDSFDIFNIPNLSEAKRVLIIDDIVDTGETLKEILRILREKFPNIEFKIATLFYKKTALIQADYSIKEANAWIDFFWEKDI